MPTLFTSKVLKAMPLRLNKTKCIAKKERKDSNHFAQHMDCKYDDSETECLMIPQEVKEPLYEGETMI
jgi:hypothetical protein